jgi:hypothetical protein
VGQRGRCTRRQLRKQRLQLLRKGMTIEMWTLCAATQGTQLMHEQARARGEPPQSQRAARGADYACLVAHRRPPAMRRRSENPSARDARITEADADRLRFIKRAQAMGFTLVDARIRELRDLRKEPAGLIADCDANTQDAKCPVIPRLAS